MPSFDYDLRFLQAGIDQLDQYLLAKDLYWPIGISTPAGETPYPQLTIGGLLLALYRLRATASTPEELDTLDQVQRRLDEIRYRWRTAWGNKAAQDFHARLNLWRDFVEDYRDNPSAHYDRYPYEVGRRVQLQLLKNETNDLPAAETQLLDALDKVFRQILAPGRFVWDENLASSFPQPVFWFLYGNLRKELGKS